MNECNCMETRKKAKDGDYDFLFRQLSQCETCMMGSDVNDTMRETHRTVRVNYITAYWKRYHNINVQEM